MDRTPFDPERARGVDAGKRIAIAPQMEALTQQIIGAAMEVHTQLGPGFSESVYEEALCHELELRGIGFVQQAPVTISYKRKIVGRGAIDILVADQVVVELKSVESLLPVHAAQAVSYLRAHGCKVGLLINFNVPHLRDGLKRVLL
jgi:GxxExxY protein